MEDINKTLINPFQLLGINYNSSELELKKSYYKLSLICHPDKGGDENDMIMISKAYKFAKDKIKNKTDKTYEELQEEFDTFCKNQTQEKCDNFGNIFEETNEWFQEFNKKFKEKQKEENLGNVPEYESDIKQYTHNPYSLDYGYGHLMDESNINIDELNKNSCNYSEKEIDNNTNVFKSEILIYKEPKTLSDFNSNPFSLVDKNITDFSTENNSDYMKAFSPPENINVSDSRLNIETTDVDSFNNYYEKMVNGRDLLLSKN